MPAGLKWVSDRLIERIVPLVGGLFASSAESLLVLGQAEQQSELEEAARRYEAEGKPEIAANLRRRAEDLGSDDPAAQGLRIAHCLLAHQIPSPDRVDEVPPKRLPQLPSFKNPPATVRRRKPAASQDESPND